jgi:hypothetical protein
MQLTGSHWQLEWGWFVGEADGDASSLAQCSHMIYQPGDPVAFLPTCCEPKLVFFFFLLIIVIIIIQLFSNYSSRRQ